jgi:hypothetical protein
VRIPHSRRTLAAVQNLDCRPKGMKKNMMKEKKTVKEKIEREENL